MHGHLRDVFQRQREYDEWLPRKIAVTDADVAAGRTFSDDEVQADALAWRAELLWRLNEAADAR